jgi:modulator of FtsH protease
MTGPLTGEDGGMVVVAGSGYEAGPWESFAVAEVGAAAALAGLLVVAGSINVARIVKLPSVVSRLGAALVLFATILVIGTILLVPDQPGRLVGVEIAAVGLLATWAVLRLRGTRNADPAHRWSVTLAAAVGTGAAGLIFVGGLFCALQMLGGLYWLVPGVILGFSVGLVNAWVALIEILR